MKPDHRFKVPTHFEADARFDVTPVPAAPFRALQETGFERLKEQLLREQLTAAIGPEDYSYVRRAANEAAALAWVSPYPLLVFPELFAEKADAALLQAARQAEIRLRSRELLAA